MSMKTRLSVKNLALPSNHPLAKEFRKIAKAHNQDLKNALAEAQRKVQDLKEGYVKFQADLSDEERERFVRLVKIISNVKPEDDCIGSPEFLSYVKEMQTWERGKTPFISKQFVDTLEQITNHATIHVPTQDFNEWLLKVDWRAIGMHPYSLSLLEDPNQGHWDIYPFEQESKKNKAINFELDKELNARHPSVDIKHSEVAIDFGTKSTTAAYLDDSGRKTLISIGTQEAFKEVSDKDFENPTIIEFRHHQKFLNDYGALEHRPFTKMEDLTTAHTAFNEFKDAEGNDYYRFFYKLKQWAGTAHYEIRLKDLDYLNDGRTWDLGNFMACTNNNPIEFYAYILGRYINNMNSGVHLKYFLSYPVKYEKEQAEKIRQSFEKGLRKSLPNGVFDEDKHQLSVELKASEPAAYAITALQAFGFARPDCGIVNYGVFDFGGGTTDFDFGTWERSAEKAFGFDISHFGAEGMKYLGGENLLELLASKVFEEPENFSQLLSQQIAVATPNYEGVDSAALRGLLDNSREGKRNLQVVVEYLREFLEGLQEDHLDDELEEEVKKIQLLNKNGARHGIELKIDYNKLLRILKEEIGKGVDNFFHALELASKKMKKLNKLHIFLGGNASRSPIVKELFLEHMEKEKARYKEYQASVVGTQESEEMDFELYPPLGTPEADEKIKQLTGRNPEQKSHFKPTCKTGVVFGLLDSRPRPRGIRVLQERESEEGPKFKFHLGIDDYGLFKVEISRDRIKVGEWVDFLDYVMADTLEFNYTDKPKAFSSDFPIHEAKRRSVRLDRYYDETHQVKVCAVNASTLKVGVFSGDGELLFESPDIHLD